MKDKRNMQLILGMDLTCPISLMQRFSGKTEICNPGLATHKNQNYKETNENNDL